MTIAIFGGSFDPPHIGHEQIVHQCLKELVDIDKLVVVPTYLNPLKSEFKLDPKTRLELIHELFDDVQNVDVSDFEVEHNQAVYSIQTVKYLKEKYKAEKIYFIIGSDNVSTLNKWKSIDELYNLVEFVVISRNGFINEHNFKKIEVDIPISSTMLKQNLNMDYIPKKIQNKVKKFWNKD